MIHTVIGYYEDDGQLFAHHVEAEDTMDAFYECSKRPDMDDNAIFVVALPGELDEGEDFDMPGEGVVDSETVLDQPDVFKGGA